MEYGFDVEIKGAYLYIFDKIITKISDDFTELTGFTEEELLGKSLTDLGEMLRINSQVILENIDSNISYFVFTKSLEVREVNISLFQCKQSNEKIYTFVEKAYSRIVFEINRDITESKKAEKSLELSNQRFNEILGSIQDVFLVLDHNWNFVYCNSKFASKIGKEPREFIGKNIWNIFPKHIGSIFEENVRQAMDKMEIRRFDIGGIYTDAYYRMAVFPSDEGITVLGIDITVQKRAEEALYKSEEKYRTLFELMNEGFSLYEVIYNDEGSPCDFRYIEVNKAYEQMTGLKSADIIGKTLLEIAPNIKGSWIELLSKVAVTEEPAKLEDYNISTKKYYENHTFSPEKGKIAVLISDISERKKYEEELKKQKDQLLAIIENMVEGISVRDKEGKMVLINATGKKILGEDDISKKTYEVAYGNLFTDLDGFPLSQDKVPMIRALKGEIVKNFVIKVKNPYDERILEINSTPVYHNNELIMAVSCGHDITELIQNQRLVKNQQEQLLQAEKEKNEALEKVIGMKDDFLSLISHELRTPLNVINSAVQAMQLICKDELSDKANLYVKMIKQNMFRQLRLVNNLLDITRADAGRIKLNKNNIDIVFLTDAIVESVQAYASQKGITVTFLPSVSKKAIRIDDEKYERILLNLLSNAIKFTPKGKSIIVRMRTVRNGICLEVIDTGIGIPKDKMEVIFERFGQVDSSLSRQAEGAGIGLSLVKRFIETLEGSISVKSKLGKGTTFKVILPDKPVKVVNEDKPMISLMDNHLVEIATVEFADIYF